MVNLQHLLLESLLDDEEDLIAGADDTVKSAVWRKYNNTSTKNSGNPRIDCFGTTVEEGDWVICVDTSSNRFSTKLEGFKIGKVAKITAKQCQVDFGNGGRPSPTLSHKMISFKTIKDIMKIIK